MKLVIDISEEKYEWVKKNNPNTDTNSIVGAITNGTPYEERPKGKWIVYKDNYGNDKPVCSCCNKEQIGYANYCSNCGADMRGDV